jgi:DNA-binding transcriptional LysR family regulator
MDPRRVLTFRAVAHERSFSAAARTLALTQPAVSQQVAALETEVGARLLDREPGGLKLTRAGEILLEHADALADRLTLAATQLEELADAERGRLRIGAFSSSIAALIPATVRRLRDEHPDAEVLVQEGDGLALAERVKTGELHLSVVFQDAALPRREHDGLTRHDILREPFLVVLPPDHPLAGRTHLALEDLADAPWSAASTDGLIVRACRAAGFEPRIVSITRDPIAIREFVAGGTAVTLVPRLLKAGMPGLAFAQIVNGPQRDVYVLTPPGGSHPLLEPTLQALIEVASATG